MNRQRASSVLDVAKKVHGWVASESLLKQIDLPEESKHKGLKTFADHWVGAAMVDAIQTGEKMFVTSDISQAVALSVATMPDLEHLDSLFIDNHGGLPSRKGLVFLESPFLDEAQLAHPRLPDHSGPRPFDGFVWMTAEDRSIYIWHFALAETYAGIVTDAMVGTSKWLDLVERHGAAAETTAKRNVKAIVARDINQPVVMGEMFCLKQSDNGVRCLFAQENVEVPQKRVGFFVALAAWCAGVAEQTEAEVTHRSQRRKLARRNISPKYRIVHLRRLLREPTDPSDPDGSTRRRHMVVGHWAKRHYGQGRSKTRLVFIAPHLRGGDKEDEVLSPERIWKVSR